MSLEVASFIFGAILCAAALFGGGFNIGGKLDIPKINLGSRLACALVGFFFLGLAFWWGSRTNPIQVQNPSPPVSEMQPSVAVPLTSVGPSSAPYFGPTKGELRHNLGQSAVVWQLAGVSLRNFVAEATFVNPSLADNHPWDLGLSFRITAESSYRIAVSSDRTWTFGYWTKDKWTAVSDGQVMNLNFGEGESNQIRLVVYASQGCVYVNDRLLAELDTSALIQPGDLAVLIGAYDKYMRTGAVTAYKDFTVYRAESLTCP